MSLFHRERRRISYPYNTAIDLQHPMLVENIVALKSVRPVPSDIQWQAFPIRMNRNGMSLP